VKDRLKGVEQKLRGEGLEVVKVNKLKHLTGKGFGLK
jgi:hypothetical protein